LTHPLTRVVLTSSRANESQPKDKKMRGKQKAGSAFQSKLKEAEPVCRNRAMRVLLINLSRE
jgi:hypothetical protein